MELDERIKGIEERALVLYKKKLKDESIKILYSDLTETPLGSTLYSVIWMPHGLRIFPDIPYDYDSVIFWGLYDLRDRAVYVRKPRFEDVFETLKLIYGILLKPKEKHEKLELLKALVKELELEV
jgi:hypothetical protein